jgi:hypothetical protein
MVEDSAKKNRADSKKGIPNGNRVTTSEKTRLPTKKDKTTAKEQQLYRKPAFESLEEQDP